jgi:hypothetical protein
MPAHFASPVHEPSCITDMRKQRLWEPRAVPFPPNCGGVFVCSRCGRATGWCRGCADDLPELCDDCWCATHDVQLLEAS